MKRRACSYPPPTTLPLWLLKMIASSKTTREAIAIFRRWSMRQRLAH